MRTTLEHRDDDLVATLTVARRSLGLWTNDPYRRIGPTMARKVYARIALPPNAPQIRSVWIESATIDGVPVDTPPPVWALERDRGKHFLHVKANYAREAPWGVPTIVIRASARETPPERLQPTLDDLSVDALVRMANQIALDAKGDPADALRALARHPRATGFQAVIGLIRSGEAHWRTQLLIEATKSPGDEQALMALADGPPLPGYGRWTALLSLGAFDTPAVRTYLLQRIENERDAGLYMSAARALGVLAETRAAPRIAKQLLAFAPCWGGVEVHLLEALVDIGSPRRDETLAAFATDPRATDGWSVLRAMQHLARSDPSTARTLATEIQSSNRFAHFPPGARRQIEAIAEGTN